MFRCIQVGTIKTIIDLTLLLVIINVDQLALSVLEMLELLLFWASLF